MSFTTWQDAVFFFANIVFGLTLVPVLCNPKASIPRISSISTSVALTAMGVTCFTIPLLYGGIANLVNATLWGMIAILRPVRAATSLTATRNT